MVIAPWWFEPAVWSDSYYLIGGRQRPDGVFERYTLKLDRIRQVRALPQKFTAPPAAEITTQVAQAWGIWEGEGARVRLRFAPHQLERLRETRWHPTERITVEDGGAVLWEADVSEPQEMLPWIRGWGADVEVLEPAGLRADLQREVQAMARLYGVGEQVAAGQEIYYAHSKGPHKEDWQFLRDHLRGVSEQARLLGADSGLAEFAYTAALLHDIGKYSQAFQRRLEGSRRRVDHKTAGALEALRLYSKPEQAFFGRLLAYVVVGHHGGLPDAGDDGIAVDSDATLAGYLKRAPKDYAAFALDLDLAALALPARLPIKPLRGAPGFSLSFAARMVLLYPGGCRFSGYRNLYEWRTQAARWV